MTDSLRCLQCGGDLIPVLDLWVHGIPPENDHIAVPPKTLLADAAGIGET